ncbi:hypothetical protein N431DRAFT_450682 [Stipitochalara longipes BDJ]|nr:hypothetical protein N431DRAFT_450682 [Stipitochalara longipes BDJ]
MRLTAFPQLTLLEKASALDFGNNLFPCPRGEIADTDGITYCCGPNGTSCCESGNSFSIPVGIVIVRQGQHLTSTTTLISPTTSSPTPPMTKTSMATTPPSTSSATSSPSSAKSLDIGLGVGISLGLILIGALVFLAWEFRRYNNSQVAASRHIRTQHEGIIDEAPVVLTNIARQELDSQSPVPKQYHQRNL